MTRSAGGRLGERVGLDVRPQIGLLLRHRLEQQPLLRREVAVDGAERDVGRRRDVAHLHGVEAAVGRELEGRGQHPAPALGLAARQRALRLGCGRHREIETRFHSRHKPQTGETARMADAQLDLLDLADKLFTGELPIESHHPFSSSGKMAEVQPRVAFVDAFANSSVVDTDDGLVAVDTSGVFHAQHVHETVRGWSPRRLDTAIFTHGHIDHVFGVDLYEEEARTNGWAPPRVVAHAALADRFDRYRLTAGYNGVINQRQFRAPSLQWPTELPLPRRDLHRPAGARRRRRARSSSSTTAARPTTRRGCGRRRAASSSRATCSSGRRPTAATRRRCSATRATGPRRSARWTRSSPSCCFPDTGCRSSAARVHQALTEGAELLETLVEQTLAMMNEGARLDDIVHSVRAPAHLLERPYLQPIYDEPEFVVRNIWRQYGGWYDGDPSHLKPAPPAVLAEELASLAGGAGRLAERAREVAAAGDLRLAGHLAELAAQAAPHDKGVHAVRAEVFGARAREEASTMSKGIYSWAEHE